MRIGLKIKIPFAQGRDKASGNRRLYKEGQFVPEEHSEEWPAETLANRLQNGYVAWEPVEDAPEEREPTLAELDKAGLLLYAEERFGVQLDKRGSEKTLREQVAMMEQRRVLKANQDAVAQARSGKPAAGKPSIFGSRAPKEAPQPATVTSPTPDAVVITEPVSTETGDAGGSSPVSTETGDGSTNDTGTTSTTIDTAGGNEPPAT